jgi:hypothetical protein
MSDHCEDTNSFDSYEPALGLDLRAFNSAPPMGCSLVSQIRRPRESLSEPAAIWSKRQCRGNHHIIHASSVIHRPALFRRLPSPLDVIFCVMEPFGGLLGSAECETAFKLGEPDGDLSCVDHYAFNRSLPNYSAATV